MLALKLRGNPEWEFRKTGDLLFRGCRLVPRAFCAQAPLCRSSQRNEKGPVFEGSWSLVLVAFLCVVFWCIERHKHGSRPWANEWKVISDKA